MKIVFLLFGTASAASSLRGLVGSASAVASFTDRGPMNAGAGEVVLSNKKIARYVGVDTYTHDSSSPSHDATAITTVFDPSTRKWDDSETIIEKLPIKMSSTTVTVTATDHVFALHDGGLYAHYPQIPKHTNSYQQLTTPPAVHGSASMAYTYMNSQHTDLPGSYIYIGTDDNTTALYAYDYDNTKQYINMGLEEVRVKCLTTDETYSAMYGIVDAIAN